MKCIRTVSWWHVYTDNMNIHWHQTAHLYLTLQILLVIQYWQSGFQRDCRADAAGALLQFISGFRSSTLYLSPQVQQFHRQAEEREDQVRHQHAGTWSLSSPLGGQASKWAGQGPPVNCAQKDGVISIQQVSQIVAKTLDGQWCHWRDGEQPRSSGEGHRRLEKQSEQSESVLLTQTQVCVCGDTPTTTNLSTKLDMYSVTHCNLLKHNCTISLAYEFNCAIV